MRHGVAGWPLLPVVCEHFWCWSLIGETVDVEGHKILGDPFDSFTAVCSTKSSAVLGRYHVPRCWVGYYF